MLHPELWPIDRIVLFAEASAAALFLERAFPRFTDCLVVSADGAFPREPRLRARALQALREDLRLRVVVFGLSALKEIPLATERFLVMDDLVMQDFRRHPDARAQGLGLDEEKMVFLIQCFFQQWDKLPRIGNTAFPYRHFAEYDEERFDWRAALFGAVRLE